MQGTTLHMVVAAVSPGETGRQRHWEGHVAIEGGKAQLAAFLF